MKYIKTYEAMNLSKDLEILNNEFSEKKRELYISYRKKVANCMQYLIDVYEVRWSQDDKNRINVFIYLTKDDDKDEFLNLLKSSVDKLDFELNGEIIDISLKIINTYGSTFKGIFLDNIEELEEYLPSYKTTNDNSKIEIELTIE